MANTFTLHSLHLFESACKRAIDVEHLTFAWIGLVDHARHRVVPVAWAGHGCAYLDGIFVDLDNSAFGRGPGGRAVREGRPRAVYDTSRDPDFWPWMTEALSRGFKSTAALPIRRGKEVVALFCLYSRELGHFDDAELQRWQAMADGISKMLPLKA